MDSNEEQDPPLLLDQYELEQQTSPHLRAISIEVLQLTEHSCDFNTSEPTSSCSQQGHAHDIKIGSSSRPEKERSKKEKKKKKKKKSTKVDLLSGENSSTTDRAPNKSDRNSPLAGRPLSSTSEMSLQAVNSSVSPLILQSQSTLSSQDKMLRSHGSDRTTTQPGAIAIQGVQTSHQDVSTSSDGEIDILESSLVEERRNSLGANLSGDPEDLSPATASLERTITATAVSREDLEQEVRERILQEAVLAEVQPISVVTSHATHRRVSFDAEPESAFSNVVRENKSQRCPKCWYNWRWWIIGLAVVLIVMGILGFILATQLPSSQREESTQYPIPKPGGGNEEQTFDDDGNQIYLRSPTTSPTLASTTHANQWNDASLKQFLIDNTFDGGVGFQIPAWTPTVAAYNYIASSNVWDESPLDEHMIDVFALLGLYLSTNGTSSWINAQGWGVQADVCSWHGVQCNDDNLVVGLSLPSNGLQGVWPPEMNNLASRLKHLDLSANVVTFGYVEASSLQPMGSLQALNLSSSGLTGTFEALLGYQLSLLQMLDLSVNFMTGSILGDLGNISQLRQLYLQNNKFTGSIPIQVSEFPNLQVVHLERNGFSGSIPPGLCDRDLNDTALFFAVDCADVNCTCCTCF